MRMSCDSVGDRRDLHILRKSAQVQSSTATCTKSQGLPRRRVGRPTPGGWEKMEREGPKPEQQDQYPAQIIQWKLNPAFRESLPSEWMKKSWDRWHMLQANKIPMAAYDVWTEESQYTRVGDDYVQTAEVTAEASDN